MRLSFVLGTAAELIKIYPLIVEAGERKLSWHVVSTGQSPIGLQKQYEDFGLDSSRLVYAAKRTLDLETIWQGLFWFVGAWFANPRKIIPEECNVIVVHGDTLSTLAGARWGRRLGLPVVHIEAGLRSGKLFSPFPEEICRRMVSKRASLHMAPDDAAAENLHRMGYNQGVFSTGGNTLADTVRLILQKHPLGEPGEPYVVANIHRFENLNRGWRWHFILNTLAKVSRRRKVFFYMHPQTRHKLERDIPLTGKLVQAGIAIEPRAPFSKFIRLVAQADYVVTDGGSNQEECYYLGVPCLILRDTTERAEGMHSNCLLAKFDNDVAEDFIAHPADWRRQPATPNWSPSTLIMDTLERTLFPSRID
jgi:UDP-N-acetylglucosamine 2-epimerase (non-hydrolysing)